MIHNNNRKEMKTRERSVIRNQKINEMAFIISEAIIENSPVLIKTMGAHGQIEYRGTIGRLDTYLKSFQIIPDHDGWAWVSMESIIEIKLIASL